MTIRSLVLRFISCLCLMTAWYFDVWWLGVILMVWHGYQYRAYEFIILGILIDVQFMTGIGIPWYTILFTAALIAIEIGKPLIRKSNSVSI